MLWGWFSGFGKCKIAFVDEQLNAMTPCNILKEYLLPFAYCFHETDHESFHLMNDGAPAHTQTVAR